LCDAWQAAAEKEKKTNKKANKKQTKAQKKHNESKTADERVLWFIP
jgi:hypothetical protein